MQIDISCIHVCDVYVDHRIYAGTLPLQSERLYSALKGLGKVNVLQCVAVCCSVLQCVAVCCNVLQCVAVWCSKEPWQGSVLHGVAGRCTVLHSVAVCCSVLLERDLTR